MSQKFLDIKSAEYLVRLIRKEIAERTDGIVRPLKCCNCGAPMKDITYCEYCGTKFM